MKCWLLRIALLAISNLAFSVSARAAPPPPRWHTNYEQATELARREGKPLFAVFR